MADNEEVIYKRLTASELESVFDLLQKDGRVVEKNKLCKAPVGALIGFYRRGCKCVGLWVSTERGTFCYVSMGNNGLTYMHREANATVTDMIRLISWIDVMAYCLFDPEAAKEKTARQNENPCCEIALPQ